MSGPPLICARCGHVSPPGTPYCPVCGEAIDPQLVTTLRWLYTSLGDLNDRIARGEGGRTLTQLRDDYHERYMELRAAPVPTLQPTATTATTVAPPAATAPGAARAAAPLAAPAYATPGAAPLPSPAAVPPPVPPRPAFSWRAFLAEQAIAIMAYMGGFLLL